MMLKHPIQEYNGDLYHVRQIYKLLWAPEKARSTLLGGGMDTYHKPILVPGRFPGGQVLLLSAFCVHCFPHVRSKALYIKPFHVPAIINQVCLTSVFQVDNMDKS